MEPLLDRLGRPLETLRISITDRCNFRCVYCMPKEVFGRDYAFLERRELLTLEELARVVGIFAGLGVRTVRITGGEPLVRRNVEHLVELLAAIDTPHGDKLELALTTNGSVLAQKAEALAAAGLSRVTVSLDSLDDAAFRAMNDVDFPVQRVLEGIDAAAAAGLPVKVNAVVKRGANDGDVLALAEHFRGSGHVLRFIEYMDVGSTNGWRLEDVVSAEEIVQRISERWPLEPVAVRAAGRDGASLALRRRRRRDRCGRVRHAALLRRLLTGPALGRGTAVHVPVRRAGPRPPRAAAPRRFRRGAHRAAARRSGRAAPTATPSCGRRKRLRCRRSRCPTSAVSHILLAVL